jgi:hypothetical protein
VYLLLYVPVCLSAGVLFCMPHVSILPQSIVKRLCLLFHFSSKTAKSLLHSLLAIVLQLMQLELQVLIQGWANFLISTT